jgi:hypothetical protein
MSSKKVEKKEEKQMLRLLNFAANSSKQNDQCCDCGLFPIEPDETFVATPLSSFDFAVRYRRGVF